MISFAVSLVLLLLGYLFYGKLVERIFQPDDRPTPAVANADGVDYIAMPAWKVYMIQFLNIAGTGPIFGAIMGAWYGPSAYLWIVFGCIFAGSVHDYFSGMLSVRHNGCNLPELVGDYLGLNAKRVMLVFSVFLLMMVGVVFVYSPALVLNSFGQCVVNDLRRFGVDTSLITRGGSRVGIYFNEKGAAQRGSVCIYDRAHSAIQEATAVSS